MSESTLSKLPLAKCDTCPLRECPVVPPWGGKTPRLILVGEAPGLEEVKAGRPFVGKSGHLLESALGEEGIAIEECYLTNAVMCRPPGNEKPSPEAIRACSDRLMSELGEFPEGIRAMALGNAAVEAVLGSIGAITSIRSMWCQLNNRWVLPTLHPAYVLRKPEDATDFFFDLRKAIAGPKAQPIRTSSPPKVVWLDTPEKIRDVVSGWVGKDVSFDFEADQVDWERDAALMMGLAVDYETGYIITDDMLYDSPTAIDILNDMSNRNHLIGHNVKFDLHFANKLGLIMFKYAVTFDTMLAHYTLDERKQGHGLKKIAREYLDVWDYDQELVHKYLRTKGDNWSKVPPESLAQYLALDVTITLAMKRIFEQQLNEKGLLEWPFKELIMKAHQLAFSMEELGMAIDCEHLEYWREKLYTERDSYHAELCRISGHPDLNPNSPIQLARIIWDERKLPQPAKQTWDKIRGQVNINPRSTSYVALFHLGNVEAGEVLGYDDEFLDVLFKYRRVAKILSTYVEPILSGVDPNGRYHDEVKVHGTETGRLATFLHTIPRETTDIYGRIIKSGFIATPGYMIVLCDYSQAELRCAAAIAGDEFLLQAYADGSDFHTAACDAIFGVGGWSTEQRILIKRYNFAYLYGGGAAALVADSNVPKDMAHKIMRDYETKMAGLARWKRQSQQDLLRLGYIQSPFGRRRRFPYINDTNYSEAMKAAVNTPVQSAAADITTLAACQMLKDGYRVLLTKHDEIIVEVPEVNAEWHANLIQQIMEETAAQYLPNVKWVADFKLRSRWCEPPGSS